jgi:cytochrome c oxidase assembly protein subunit 15
MVWALRTPALNPRLRSLAGMALALLALQIMVGIATLRLHLQIELLTIAHHSIGASLLGVLVVFTVLTLRDGSPGGYRPAFFPDPQA